MNKYAELYLDTLASEYKEAGLGDIASGLWEGAKGIGKSFVVDPAVGMFSDTGSAIGSAVKGDWSAAGGSALSALGNTLMTAGNVATLLPLAGPAIGWGARGLGMAAKGLQAARGLSGAGKLTGVLGKSIGGLQKAQQALGASGHMMEAKNLIDAGGATIGKNLYRDGKLVFGNAPGKGIGEMMTSQLRRGQTGIAGNLAQAGDKFKSFLGNTPLGGITGFKNYGLNKLPPLTGLGKTMNIVKPLAGFTGLQMGADALRSNGLENQFNDLAVDPNFRNWMGPDRQDAWLENARTSSDKIRSMKALRDGGYVNTYKKHLSDTMQAEKQRASDEARKAMYDAGRRQNVG